jgi:hypothetical protein
MPSQEMLPLIFMGVEMLLLRHFETENLEDVNILCRFLFTVNRNEDIVRESFSFKLFYVLRDHLSSNFFMIFQLSFHIKSFNYFIFVFAS